MSGDARGREGEREKLKRVVTSTPKEEEGGEVEKARAHARAHGRARMGARARALGQARERTWLRV